MRSLRTLVNRALEECRINHGFGASLEAAVRIELKDENLIAALEWLTSKGDVEVDGFRDWLLVSHLQFGGEPWAEFMETQESDLAIVEVAKARGQKCNRCWHFESDLGLDSKHPSICSRCVEVISRI